MGKKRTKTIEGEQLETGQVKKIKKSSKKTILKGIANISSSYNNTILSVADPQGNVFAWSTAGSIGFKGTRKSTPYAATLVARDVAEKIRRFGTVELSVVVRGIGPGREAAIRGLAGAGLNIKEIIDDTPLPHNGARPPKPRRI